MGGEGIMKVESVLGSTFWLFERDREGGFLEIVVW